MVEGREQNRSAVRHKISVYVEAVKTLRSVLVRGCNKEVPTGERLASAEQNVDKAYSALLGVFPDNQKEMVLKISFLIDEVLANADLTEYHKSGLKTAIQDLKKVITPEQLQSENQTVDVIKTQ